MEQPGIVPLRIGVNTGKVFTGDFGPPYRRAYRVFGDAINTAARVMAKAEPGQILSTEIVLNRSRTVFETTPDPAVRREGQVRTRPGLDRRAGHRHAGVRTRRRCRCSGASTELRTLLDAVEPTASRATAPSSSSSASPGSARRGCSTRSIARSPRLPDPPRPRRGVRVVDAVLRRCARSCGPPSISTRPPTPSEVVDRLRTRASSRRSGRSSRGSRCSASCSGSTSRRRPRPRPSTSASCAIAWPR